MLNVTIILIIVVNIFNCNYYNLCNNLIANYEYATKSNNSNSYSL